MLYKALLPLALPLLSLAQENASPQNLTAALSNTTNLSNLTTFLSASPELLSSLSNASNITILAPSDEAFAKFAEATGGDDAITSDVGLLAAVLTYHVLNGSFASDLITNTSQFLPTYLSNETYANVTGGQVVEAVMIGNETVFYSGLLQNSTVSQADVEFSGGVIHIVDSVLTLPANVSSTALSANLTSLYGALNFTDTVSVVDETPDITVFAPSNEAFQAIGSALQNISAEDLGNVLAYHVVNGTVGYSSALENGTTLTSLGGGELEVTIDENGTYYVNAARVITPNVLVANGVVHIIDNVLNPDNTEGPAPDATSGAPGFSATPVADVPYTSGLPTPTRTVNPTSEGAGPANTAAEGSATSSAGAMPMITGAVGYGALLGAGAAVFLGA